jgi:endoglucanase
MPTPLPGLRGSHGARRRLLGVTSALVLCLAVVGIRAEPGAAAALLVRVNQVGYTLDAPKGATVMAQRSLGHARFVVLDAHGRRVIGGRLGRRRPAFSSRWRYVYDLDLSALRVPGLYRVVVDRVRSTIVRIASGSSLFGPLAQHAVTFFQAQRDGPDIIPGVMHRVPAHLRDAQAAVYRTPRYQGFRLLGQLVPAGTTVDASGGWFDAGDYLKFVETASFSDVMALFTLRQYSSGVGNPSGLAAEARFGTDWLLKMWDQQRRVLYFQVGIGDGNARTLGDHDLWRLPQADDRRSVRPGSPAYFVTNRKNDQPQSCRARSRRLCPVCAGLRRHRCGLCPALPARRADHLRPGQHQSARPTLDYGAARLLRRDRVA